MNPDVILIKVVIEDPRAPYGSLPQQVWLNVNRHEFRDAFTPLPRDRELPFDVEGRSRAIEIQEARHSTAEYLARQLAPKLVEAMGKIDTINGYTPKEWQEMHSLDEAMKHQKP